MPKKLPIPEIIYKESDNINSEEAQRKLAEAYDILFEEVLKDGELKQTHADKRSNRRVQKDI